MRTWRVVLAPDAAAAVRSLAPDLKSIVRESLTAIARDPGLGKELHRELRGLRTYRARRYRIVYELQSEGRVIRIVAVAHRSTIYEDLAKSRGA